MNRFALSARSLKNRPRLPVAPNEPTVELISSNREVVVGVAFSGLTLDDEHAVARRNVSVCVNILIPCRERDVSCNMATCDDTLVRSAIFVKGIPLGVVICLAFALLIIYKISKEKKPVRLATIVWAAVVVLASAIMLAAPSSSTNQAQAAAQDAPATAVEQAPAPSKQ